MDNSAGDRAATLGLVLDGGRARRMGGADKGLMTLAGRPMIAHAVERLRPQVAEPRDQRQRRSGPFRRPWLAGRSPTIRRIFPAPSPGTSPGSINARANRGRISPMS